MKVEITSANSLYYDEVEDTIRKRCILGGGILKTTGHNDDHKDA
jgi:hypothetical protein